MCVCVCVCVCAHARVCVCACALFSACVCVCGVFFPCLCFQEETELLSFKLPILRRPHNLNNLKLLNIFVHSVLYVKDLTHS